MTELNTVFVWVIAVLFILNAVIAPVWVTHDRPKLTPYGAALTMLCNVIIAVYMIGSILYG